MLAHRLKKEFMVAGGDSVHSPESTARQQPLLCRIVKEPNVTPMASAEFVPPPYYHRGAGRNLTEIPEIPGATGDG